MRRQASVAVALCLWAVSGAAWAEEPASGPILELDGDATPTEGPVDLGVQRGPNDNSARVAMYKRTSLLQNLTTKLSFLNSRTTIGGYGEAEFVKEQGQDSYFQHHRYVLFFNAQIHDRISTSTEFEVEFGGSPRKSDGVQVAGEAILEFSVVDLRVTDWLNLRGGIVLVPFGVYNLRHDAPTQDLSERPLALTTITPTTWFEAGVGVFGKIPIGDTTLSYEAYVINGLDAKISESGGMKGAIGSKGEDNNDDKAVVGRVSYSPNLMLEFGASGYTGAYDDQKRRIAMASADVTGRWGRVELQGEYVRAWIDPGFVQGFSASSVANTRLAVPEGMQGWYLQSNVHFTIPGLWDLLPADLSEATMTGVLRVESADTNTNVVNQYDVQKVTLGLNFRPVEAYVIKTEVQAISRSTDGQAHHIASGDWQFTPKFVASMAFLF